MCFPFVWLTVRSGDAQDGHHARHLMVHDVAMQHPIAGVIGDKGAFHDISGRQEDGVGPLAMRRQRPIAAEHPEAVAVQMHRMPPCRLIAYGQ